MIISLLCVAYMYAIPAQTQIIKPESPVARVLPVASQPTRMAFVAYSEDSRIKAFWKQPEESTYRFTIEIDPLSSESEENIADDFNSAGDDSEDQNDQAVQDSGESDADGENKSL